jgi:DEAD/DEAH box helicase domain-containing protein
LNSAQDFFGDPVISDQIAHLEEFAPRKAVFGEPNHPIHPDILARLRELEISRLYSHQAQAFDAAMAGEDVIVVTGTNSGKTMCYNLPALQMCLREPAVRCFYLFPTKALAHDQQGKLEALVPGSQVRVATYDGDTPKSHRPSIRKLSHIVLTNPDMMHVGILPGQEHWAKFFKSLRLIVLDEMHVYRGVFGSNVGNVIRRLLRLCAWHKCRPQIIACSATIGNPEQLFQRLTGRGATMIDADGSPSGKRTFVFWNPPELGDGRRLSANAASSEILASLTESGQRTMAFSRARISAELVLRYTRRRVKEGGRIPEESIESYRSGYTAKERRQIEEGLFKGRLLGLSTTNAMELGVDVGGLDAVILNGYPGTASSFWQQAGRAGRGSRDGIAIFVAHDDPLEQFLIRRPDTVLGARSETVGANPENPQILAGHLLCAAQERPITPTELGRFGGQALEIAEGLDRNGELQFSAGMFFYPSFEPPALRVNIRGSGGEQVRLVIDGEELGTMERWRAMMSAHAGAVYLHRGATFLVKSLDLDHGLADVVAFDAPYYTQAVTQSVLDPRVTLDARRVGSLAVSLCAVTVTDSVLAFRKKSLDGDSVLDTEPLDLPAQTYDTLCVRFDLDPFEEEQGDAEAHIGGIHGMEHALTAVAPLIAGCDRGDLGSAWYTVFPDNMQPAVFVFDRAPGGVGLCERLFESASEWVRAAHQLVLSCNCDAGCPSCLYSPRCEVSNEALSKMGTLRAFDPFSP